MEQTVTPNNLPPMAGNERSVAAPAPQAGSAESHRMAQPPAAPEYAAGGGEQFTQSQGGGGQPFIAPVTPPPVQPVAQGNQPSAANGVASTNPSLADDVDVIEKEWVDRAKQIVAATHDDPHAQEQQVSKLQSDYLKKRYGKDVTVPEQ